MRVYGVYRAYWVYRFFWGVLGFLGFIGFIRFIGCIGLIGFIGLLGLIGFRVESRFSCDPSRPSAVRVFLKGFTVWDTSKTTRSVGLRVGQAEQEAVSLLMWVFVEFWVRKVSQSQAWV